MLVEKTKRQIYAAAYRANNPEKVIASRAAYCARHREKLKAQYAANREKILADNKIYHRQNRERLLAGYRANYAEHREERLAWARAYNAAHPEVRLAYRRAHRRATREYARARRKKNPGAKLAHSIRNRIYMAIKSVEHKSAPTRELLGCTIPELRAHLESQFRPGMTWENYGPAWHVDHRRPCASFDLLDPAQQRECFHYTNLQPLFAEENLKKGAR